MLKNTERKEDDMNGDPPGWLEMPWWKPCSYRLLPGKVFKGFGGEGQTSHCSLHWSKFCPIIDQWGDADSMRVRKKILPAQHILGLVEPAESILTPYPCLLMNDSSWGGWGKRTAFATLQKTGNTKKGGGGKDWLMDKFIMDAILFRYRLKGPEWY